MPPVKHRRSLPGPKLLQLCAPFGKAIFVGHITTVSRVLEATQVPDSEPVTGPCTSLWGSRGGVSTPGWGEMSADMVLPHSLGPSPPVSVRSTSLGSSFTDPVCDNKCVIRIDLQGEESPGHLEQVRL